MKTTLDIKHIAGKMHTMVSKAIGIIQKHSHNPVPIMKMGYGQKEGETPDDFATQGDIEAQDMYFAETASDKEFNGIGIIGEEGLNVPCTHFDHDVYLTIDPLDGTKAYGRRQSYGVGTMIALVIDGVIMAAFIGDANTGEVYGYAIDPKGNGKTFVIPPTRFKFGEAIPIVPNIKTAFAKRYVNLREAPSKHPMPFRKMIGEFGSDVKLFKDIEVSSGSFGLYMARLWNNEMGAMIVMHRHHTPWDATPVNGFNRVLGIKGFRYDEKQNTLVPFDQENLIRVKSDVFTQIFVHESRADELLNWFEKNA